MAGETDERNRRDFVSSAYQKAVQSTGISVPMKTLHAVDGGVMVPGFVYYDPRTETVLEPFPLLPDAAPKELYLTQQFKEQLRHARFPGDEATAVTMIAAAVNRMPEGIAEERETAAAASRLLAGVSASLFNAASLPQEEKSLAAWRFRQGLRNSHQTGFNPDLWVVYNTAAEKLLGGLGVEEHIGPLRKEYAGSKTSQLLEILEQMRTRRRIPEAMENLTGLLYEGELPSRKVLKTAISKIGEALGYDPTFLVPLGNAEYMIDLRRRTGGGITANPDVLDAVLKASGTSRDRVNALNALYCDGGERLLYRGEAQGLPRIIVERPELERAGYQRTTEVPDTVIIIDTNGMGGEPNHVHDINGEYHKAVLAAEGVAQLILSRGGRVMPIKRTSDGYAVDAFTGNINDVEGAFSGHRPSTYTHEAMLRLLQEPAQAPLQVVYIGTMREGVPAGLVPSGSIVYHINPSDATRDAARKIKGEGFLYAFDSADKPTVVSTGEYRNRGTPARGYVSLR